MSKKERKRKKGKKPSIYEHILSNGTITFFLSHIFFFSANFYSQNNFL